MTQKRTPAKRFHDAMERFSKEALAAFADAQAQRIVSTITLGEMVKNNRHALGMSLEDVAKKAGFTKSHIWEIEAGRSVNPTVQTVAGLAQALGLPSDMVFRAALVRKP